MKIKKRKIIAIIPARGGSKGIPKKNIRLLRGKPLISYTLESALGCRYFDRVIVSTDSREISEVVKKYGAEVIRRPLELSRDQSKIIDAVLHTLTVLKKNGYEPNIVVLLQPTSPLRNVKDIDKAIELFLKNKCESVISVCQIGHPPYWSFRKEKKYLTPTFGWRYFRLRRQDLPKSYIPNGAIYISKLRTLLKYKSFYSKKVLPYIMPPERSIDIDNELDFKLAEFFIKKWKK